VMSDRETNNRETYDVTIGGVERKLPKIEVAPGVKIALLNILGDVEFVNAAVEGLADKLDLEAFDVIVTAEAKSIPLAHKLAERTNKPYVVLRKTAKPYMGKTVWAETNSITTDQPQTLFLDEKDHALIDGKRVLLVDDVVSTGSTQQGMKTVMEKAGATVVAESAIFTEGNDPAKWQHIIALGNLPLFFESE